MIKKIFILLFIFFSHIHANKYITLEHPESTKRGLFSVMDHVFGNLYIYLHNPKFNNRFSGLKVDFGKKGLYYDSTKGSNWWSYYFEPIEIGDLIGKEFRFKKMIDKSSPFFLETNLHKDEVKIMVDEFLKLKPEIESLIEKFKEEYFSDFFMIGIHYRGTDKSNEAPRVPYKKVLSQINDLIDGFNKPARIFVATDEQDFLDFMVENLGDAVIYIAECVRSKDGFPIHIYNDNPYITGLYSVMDAVLLSQCNILIRTSSNLSRWSTYMNPDMPVIELSKRLHKIK